MSYIYLASPYSDPERHIRFLRYTLACKTVATLYMKGVTVFSPIVHCHYIAGQYNLPTDADFWWKHNKEMLDKAYALYILDIDEWQHSEGVRQEIKEAHTMDIQCHMVKPGGDVYEYVKPELWELD